MNLPKISVVLPVYNGARFLETTLQSVAAQTYPNFELIAINDGSTDDSAQILDALHGAKVIHQTNHGTPHARNQGLRAATGDFIAFLDQDDHWAPDKTTVQLAALKADPDLDLVLGHWVHTLVDDGPAPAWATAKYFDGPKPGWVLGAMLARRRVFDRIGLLNETFSNGNDDVDWFNRMKDASVAHRVLPDVVLDHRIHTNNHSADTKRMNKELLRVMRAKVARNRSQDRDKA